jgi:hypothetical protein
MPKPVRERFHLHLAPMPATSAEATLARIVALGATPLDSVQPCAGAIALADVDGNHFCLMWQP